MTAERGAHVIIIFLSRKHELLFLTHSLTLLGEGEITKLLIYTLTVSKNIEFTEFLVSYQKFHYGNNMKIIHIYRKKFSIQYFGIYCTTFTFQTCLYLYNLSNYMIFIQIRLFLFIFLLSKLFEKDINKFVISITFYI